MSQLRYPKSPKHLKSSVQVKVWAVIVRIRYWS